MKATNIVVFAEGHDLKYVHKIKPYFPNNNLKVVSKVDLITIALDKCAEYRTTKAIVYSTKLLTKIVNKYDPNTISTKEGDELSNNVYQGSLFVINGVQFLVLPSPNLLIFKPEMPYLHGRWCQKLTNPNFPSFPELDWKVLRPENIIEFYNKCKDKAILIAVDSETVKELVDPEKIKDNPEDYQGIWSWMKKGSGDKMQLVPVIPKIVMVSYTALFKNERTGAYYSETGVLRLNSVDDVVWMRMFNALKAPKVLQNGGYDCTYFLRYNAPLYAYLYDTYVFMHSWLVELSRNLAFITSLFDKSYIYWKDESDFRPEEYAAKDTHNTLWSWIYMVQTMPQYAYDNYVENFRMQFPCITCGTEGIAINPEQQEIQTKELVKKIAHNTARLEKLIAPGFNANSSPQVLKLLHGLGYKKAKDTNDKTLQDFIDSHPLFDIIGNLIREVREDRKALGTYFKLALLNGRLLYELNPCGTDTGRLASKASNLWCGTQIQNIPPYAKKMCVADEGWEFGAADNSQSESRCTAYMSEDANLLAAVEDKGKDFHKINASLFFGMPYEEITKDIRTLSKRTNHGANYNMGPLVLFQTMGRKAVATAQKLLGLPMNWKPLKVTEYLLSCFDKAYPDIRGKFYSEIISQIQRTGFLVGPTGWTRRCFGDPTASKPQLNSYVAHGPQSLSVKIINSAFFDLWLKLQIKERKARFKAQVHDEIFWQCRPEDNEYCATVVSERMKQPTVVRGRVMVIPNDPKFGYTSWGDMKD